MKSNCQKLRFHFSESDNKHWIFPCGNYCYMPIIVNIVQCKVALYLSSVQLLSVAFTYNAFGSTGRIILLLDVVSPLYYLKIISLQNFEW